MSFQISKLKVRSKLRGIEPGAIKLSRKTNRELLCQADQAPLLLFGVTLFVVTLMLLGYPYGQFDDYKMSRLSLPSHLLLIFPGVIYLGRFEKSRQAWWCAFVLAVIGFFAQTLPTVYGGEQHFCSNLRARDHGKLEKRVY